MKQIFELVATTPSSPLGAWVVVTLDILVSLDWILRCGTARGGTRDATFVYTLNFQNFPSVLHAGPPSQPTRLKLWMRDFKGVLPGFDVFRQRLRFLPSGFRAAYS